MEIAQRDDGGPLAELASINEARHELERREAVAVRRARHAGYSWAEVATILGVSRQAAHKKFGRRS